MQRPSFRRSLRFNRDPANGLAGVSKTRLANAELVLEYAPELVAGILAGSAFLDAA
jgi:hypothetical protein